jgi:hypothetical protein
MPALLDSPIASHHHRNGKPPRIGAADAIVEPAPAPAFPAAAEQELSLDELIFDYLTLSMPLPSLARRHRLTLEGLATALESEAAQSLIRRMTRLAAQRARTLAIQNRASAIASLETTMATTDDPETARKAATTLIRASDRVLYPPRRKRATKAKIVVEQQESKAERVPDAPSTSPAFSAPPRLRGENPVPPGEPRPRQSLSGAG